MTEARKFRPLDEYQMINACAGRFSSADYRFCNFYYRRDHEADLFIISKARYATEIEVKLSLADWRADFKKSKHSTNKYIKFFYYAVPDRLVDKAPPEMDSRYGIIAVHQSEYGDVYTRMVKPAEQMPCVKVPKGIICQAFLSSYYRNIDLRQSNSRLMNEVYRLRQLISENEAAP